MIEIPEAIVISNQLNQTVKGKKIKKAVATVAMYGGIWCCKNGQEK